MVEVIPSSEAGVARRIVAKVNRPVPATILVLIVLWGVSLMLDTGGYLGTDTGGKVATIQAMAERPLGLDPDIGFWASEWNHDENLHGIGYTTLVGERYVNVTTLPMIEVAAPLYRLGGYRLALLLPILGCVAVAFAARALVLRLGGSDRRSWMGFWIMALASPVTIYALDLWEHSIGLAFMAWGIVALIDAATSHRWAWCAAGGGLAFGLAYSLRTEALVYAFVATAVLAVGLLVRRQVVRAIGVGFLMAVGLGCAVFVNDQFERHVLGAPLRAGRASDTARSGGSETVLRLKEAVLTAFGVDSGMGTRTIAISIVLAVLVISLMVLLVRRADGRAVALVGAGIGAIVLGRVVAGPGFLPGVLPAAPLVALGLVVAWRLRARTTVRYVVAVATLSLPLVWAFQYTGGAGPQWGGRYLLLTVVGIVGLDQLPRRAAMGLVAVAVAITWLGVGWLVIRSHEVADAAQVVTELPEPVVIFTEPLWSRELADGYPGSRWLGVRTRAQLDAASVIVTEAGFDSFALIEADPTRSAPEVPGFEPVESFVAIWLSEEFRITSYERST